MANRNDFEFVTWIRNWAGFDEALMAKVISGLSSKELKVEDGEVHLTLDGITYKLAFIEAAEKWYLYSGSLKNTVSVCEAETVRRRCGENWRTSAEFLYCFQGMNLLDRMIDVNLDPHLFWWVPVDRQIVDHPEYWDDEGMDEVDSHHDWWIELV